MDSLSKRLWIAVGAVALLTIVIGCIGAAFAVHGFLGDDEAAPAASAPAPVAAAPVAAAPVAAPVAQDPITVTVRGLGLDVLGAARGVAPSRPWFTSPYSGEVRLAAEGTELEMVPLGASPELVFVSLELEAYRRTGPSHAELIEGALMVFADGRVRYTEVHRRDMTDDFVLTRLESAMQFPETTPDERMLRASVDRFLRGVSTCTVQAPDASDLIALPFLARSQILDDIDPARTAEACRAVAASGPGAYDVRNVGSVAVFARGQGHIARVSTRFMAFGGSAAVLIPVRARVEPML